MPGHNPDIYPFIILTNYMLNGLFNLIILLKFYIILSVAAYYKFLFQFCHVTAPCQN